MPVIKLPPDTLDAQSARFRQTPLGLPVFLNSVPKCGTHLLRNIVRMFVPVEQQYQREFIQWRNLEQHRQAFDPLACCLSWGHLPFSDASAIALQKARKLLLVRDPRTWVLARARFFLADEFSSAVDHAKGGALQIEELLNLIIFGIHQKMPPLLETYAFMAVAWLGTGATLVRYEDLLRHLRDLQTPQAEDYFRGLLGDCGIAPLPDDWRERVLIGADRRHSATARENLTGVTIEIPQVLPQMQARLIEYAAPGLRALLGYAD